jgi:hypothetical protein
LRTTSIRFTKTACLAPRASIDATVAAAMPRAALGVAAGEIIEGEKHGEARQARNLPIAFPGRDSWEGFGVEK